MTQPGRTTPFPEGGQVRVLQDLDFQEKKNVPGVWHVHCWTSPPLVWGGSIVRAGMCFQVAVSLAVAPTLPPPTHTHTHCLRQGSCQRLHRASQAMRHRLPACLPKPLVAYTLSSGVASYSSLGAPRSTLCNWPMTAPNFPCEQWIRDLSLCGRARVRWWGTGRGSYCWQGNSLSQSP